MGNKAAKENNNAANNENAGDEFDDEDAGQTPQQKPSYWQMMQQGYQELVNAIIRPPRCKYSTHHLGPASFHFCGRMFQRTDFELRNLRGLKIVCSMWEPAPEFRQNPVLPCVIYMHGNSSARLEGIPQLALVLSLGITLLAFDFCGSGLSEGEYVSLGAFEKDDLKAVIEHLRAGGTTSTIALWGRSMGAATSLLHGERDPSLAGMVLDSSFADLQMLAEEMVEKGRQHGLFAPSLIVKIAIRFIRSTVMKTAGFDIKTLSPIEHADKCFIPALFIAAEGDAFVPPHHSQKIHEKYAGDKNVIIVEGDHNSARPRYCLDSVSIFLQHTLQIPEEWIIIEGQKYAGTTPWQGQQQGRSKAVRPKSAIQPPAPPQGAMGEIGMTSELQADVQAKLFRALGDRGAASSAVRAGTGAASASSSSAGQQHDQAAADVFGAGMDPAMAQYIEYDDDDDGDDFSGGDWTAGYGDLMDGQEILLQQLDGDAPVVDDATEWQCATCTLINPPVVLACTVCGMPRDQMPTTHVDVSA